MTRISDLLDSDFATIVAVTDDPAAVLTDLTQIRQAVARGVLRKNEDGERILRKLYQDCGAALIQNVRLERSSRRTDFDEDQFVRFYPYLPHLIDLSFEIAERGRNVITQCNEMLAPGGTRLAGQPTGALVSLDRIYEVAKGSIPGGKRKTVLDVQRRFRGPRKYRGVAVRVARAICLMELVKTDLPRSAANIAALLIQHVSEAPATPAIAEILHELQKAELVRETEDGWTLLDFDELRNAAAALERLGSAVGTVNPRLPGWHNRLIQLAKKGMARALSWYTRPLNEFNTSVGRLLGEIAWSLGYLAASMPDPEDISGNTEALDRISADLVALERRLARLEKRNEPGTSSTAAGHDSHAPDEPIEEQLEFLREKLDYVQEQVRALISVPEMADPEARKSKRFHRDTGAGKDRTAYIIGLFGSGRWYINELLLQHVGERAGFFRDMIRLHPGPTSMIYSGHATMRHPSRLQYPPIAMSQIMEAVGSRFADSVFIYRHPLDSLLTNWVWWRTFIRENRMIGSISQVFKNTDELCAELDRNFSEFEAFAENDPAFFAAEPGPRFLSFAEFVEETELHVRSASLSLRLEDFSADPAGEFSRIAGVMSVVPEPGHLCVAPPRTKPYRHVEILENVPRFRDFVRGRDADTKRRMEKMGYGVGG